MLKDSKKVVGLKQSRRVIREGLALKAFLAWDTEDRIAEPFLSACAEAGVEVERVETMAALGQACGLDVGAAAAVLLK